MNFVLTLAKGKPPLKFSTSARYQDTFLSLSFHGRTSRLCTIHTHVIVRFTHTHIHTHTLTLTLIRCDCQSLEDQTWISWPCGPVLSFAQGLDLAMLIFCRDFVSCAALWSCCFESKWTFITETCTKTVLAAELKDIGRSYWCKDMLVAYDIYNQNDDWRTGW